MIPKNVYLSMIRREFEFEFPPLPSPCECEKESLSQIYHCHSALALGQ